MTTTPSDTSPSETLADRARAALHGVHDPELGLDIVTMGLVYDLRAEDGPDGPTVEVDMTLTTPGCPVSESLPLEADAAVRAAVPGVGVVVRVVWDPPWTPERLSPATLESLGRPPR